MTSLMQALKGLEKLSEARPKITKIKFHLQSQAKPQSSKCTPAYYRELVSDIEEIEGALKILEGK